MIYYYIHGMNSSANSSTAQNIEKAIGQQVVPLSWKCDTAYKSNMQYLMRQVNKITVNRREIVFLGTSLGAFYATYLSKIYRSPCVIFNPVVYPRQLKKFVGPQKNHQTKEAYIFTNGLAESYEDTSLVKHDIRNQMHIFVSGCDEVLSDNVKLVMAKFSHRACITVTHTKHRISDFTPYKDTILSVAQGIML